MKLGYQISTPQDSDSQPGKGHDTSTEPLQLSMGVYKNLIATSVRQTLASANVSGLIICLIVVVHPARTLWMLSAWRLCCVTSMVRIYFFMRWMYSQYVGHMMSIIRQQQLLQMRFLLLLFYFSFYQFFLFFYFVYIFPSFFFFIALFFFRT